MLEKFSKLDTVWKVVIIGFVLVISVFIFDAFTGKVSDARNWWFDRNIAKIEQKNKQLEEENTTLRLQVVEFKTKAEEADIKAKALDAQIEKVGGQIVTVRNETEKALEEIRKEEVELMQPMEDFTRCTKLKEKLTSLNIKSAKEINCDVYK